MVLNEEKSLQQHTMISDVKTCIVYMTLPVVQINYIFEFNDRIDFKVVYCSKN